MEHLPAYEADSGSSSSGNLKSTSNHEPFASSSTDNHKDEHSDDHHQQEQEDDVGESTSHYIKPRLREEITDHKKQEVYEEKGHSDGEYDHLGYHGETRQPDRHHHQQDYDYEPSDSNHHHHRHKHQAKNNRKNRNNYKYNRQPQRGNYYNPEASSTNNNYKRSRLYSSLHEPDGTSTKVLEYAAKNLYDRDAHEKGLYASRENIYCPEVIDFDLSSKKMAMGQGGNNPRGAKPRLKGLGSKITCLKNKYFGREPLPKAIFLDPSESRHSVIEIPTFDQFYSSIKHHVGSMSSFQH